ncbi:MAG: hypothetical protein JXX14_12250 [Deltaproteobacteria bacterium]|nr:hypothetical protein [Deltaproteobacteria bacterium]
MTHGTSSLLKIDVALEIQKLTQNRFKSSTEWAVALCRHLISQQSSALEIQVVNGHLQLRSRGTRIDSATLRRLSVIFETRQPLDARHTAIVEIENSASFELLCAFYLNHATVYIESNGNSLAVLKGRHTSLAFSQNQNHAELNGHNTTIDVKSGKIKATSLTRVLGNACRHSRMPVFLNGRAISEGLVLPNCFAQETFEVDGVQGVIGIPMESDFVRQVTLRHGVVVKDALKQPAFGLLYHAIADSTHEIDELQHLRSVVRNMYLTLRSEVEHLQSLQRRRALEVLFGRFLETKDRKYIYGVHAFENVEGLRFTIEQVQRLASQGPLFGVPPMTAQPSQTSPPWLVCGRRVLVLDARQWTFLEKELNITITVPPVTASDKRLSPSVLKYLPKASTSKKVFNPDIRLAAERIFRNMG